MRLYTIICAAILAAAALCIAAPRAHIYTLSTGTNTSATVTATNLRGTLAEVHANGHTGALSVVRSVIAGAPLVVATGTVEVTKSWRPRIDFTGTDGAGLTSDEPGPVWLTGDVSITVSGAATGQVWTVNLVVDP